MKRLIISLLLMISGVMTIGCFSMVTGGLALSAMLLNIPSFIIAPVQLLLMYREMFPLHHVLFLTGLLATAFFGVLLGSWFYENIWGKFLIYMSGVIWAASVFVGVHFYTLI